MTGSEMMHKALVLLNYTNTKGEVDAKQSAELFKRGLPMLNLILADLSRIEKGTVIQLASVDDDIPLSDVTLYDVMPYGVAMMVAQGERDGDGQQMMAAIYNQKRGIVPHASGTVKNVIPVPLD